MANLDEINDNWDKIGILEGVEDKRNCAMCLQAQLKFNEESDLPAQFIRLSIPVVRRLHGSECFQRNRFTNYFEDNETKSMFFFKTKYNPPTQQFTGMLEQEAEYIAEFVENLASELDSAFQDKMGAEVIFHGLGLIGEQTVVMYYS